METKQRIDLIRLDEVAQHAGNSDHEQEPDERETEEEHQREDQACCFLHPRHVYKDSGFPASSTDT